MKQGRLTDRPGVVVRAEQPIEENLLAAREEIAAEVFRLDGQRLLQGGLP